MRIKCLGLYRNASHTNQYFIHNFPSGLCSWRLGRPFTESLTGIGRPVRDSLSPAILREWERSRPSYALSRLRPHSIDHSDAQPARFMRSFFLYFFLHHTSFYWRRCPSTRTRSTRSLIFFFFLVFAFILREWEKSRLSYPLSRLRPRSIDLSDPLPGRFMRSFCLLFFFSIYFFRLISLMHGVSFDSFSYFLWSSPSFSENEKGVGSRTSYRGFDLTRLTILTPRWLGLSVHLFSSSLLLLYTSIYWYRYTSTRTRSTRSLISFGLLHRRPTSIYRVN